ncbi:MAG: GTPase ObgE [Planctomycetes bacterium]|nr:GTPase ObgE [Planctomycetota bacterium]
MLIDRAVILVRSGKGGDGHVSFARYKYIPKGGPDGGDGGNGGSVWLVATAGVDTLLDFAGKHHWDAEPGERGGKKQCYGKSAEDMEIRLPLGTLVYDENTGELLGDLDAPGKKLLIAKGGKGGFGNEHFMNSTNQAPRIATPGEPGEERLLRFELKLIADVGIIGKPNAGKSTLLSRISRATPKIADYPFTTLEPNLGIAEITGQRRLVFADIPGLIEGAHEGHGLGMEFLRHVERTRVLVHLLDVEPTDGSEPSENYRVICNELSQYSELLASKTQLVAVSKMDLLPNDADRAAAKELIEQAIGRPVMVISSASGQGLEELLEKCWELVQASRQEQQIEESRRVIEAADKATAAGAESRPNP